MFTSLEVADIKKQAGDTWVGVSAEVLTFINKQTNRNPFIQLSCFDSRHFDSFNQLITLKSFIHPFDTTSVADDL